LKITDSILGNSARFLPSKNVELPNWVGILMRAMIAETLVLVTTRAAIVIAQNVRATSEKIGSPNEKQNCCQYHTLLKFLFFF
jgi:hypothetical protein